MEKIEEFTISWYVNTVTQAWVYPDLFFKKFYLIIYIGDGGSNKGLFIHFFQ